MKSFLKHILIRKNIGICVAGDATFITEVESPLLGGRTITQKEYPHGDAQDTAAIAQALKQHFKGRENEKARMAVAVTIPGKRCYCMTLEAPAESKDQTSIEGENSDLSGMLRTAMAHHPDQYVVERCSGSYRNQQFNTTLACNRTVLTAVADIISETMHTSVIPLLQPVPWAAAVAATSRHKPPKTAKPWMLLHLDRNAGMAILMCQARPMGWWEFNVQSMKMVNATRQAALRLGAFARNSLGLEKPDVACLEGVPELVTVAAAILTDSGFTVIKREPAVVFGKDASLGAALAGLDASSSGSSSLSCDLATSLRPLSKFKDIIPIGDIVLTCTLIFVLWLAAFNRREALFKECQHVRKESDHQVQALGIPDLKPMGARSEDVKVQAIRDAEMDKKLNDRLATLTGNFKEYSSFFEGRRVWSVYLESIPEWIPEQIHLLTLLAAVSEPWSKGKAKRNLELTGVSDLATIHGLPETIPQMLNLLRAQPLLQKDFPNIQLGNVHARRDGGVAHIEFGVSCLPAAAKAETAAKPKAAGAH